MRYDFNIARRLFWRDMAFFAACIGISWLCGAALSAVLVYFLFQPGDGYVAFGTFCALLGLFVAVVACRNQNANTRYQLAVAMGQSRRGYLLTEIVSKFLQCLLSLGLAALLHLAELGFVVDSDVTVVSEISGNLILQVKDSRIALDKTMANRIMI